MLKFKSIIILPILMLIFTASVHSGSGDIFWRYSLDRFDRPILTERLEVPEDGNPFKFLANYLGYKGWIIRQEANLTVMAERSGDGEIPVLCFHKLGEDERFTLTKERFKTLLEYIRDENWYLVSDYQYLIGDLTRVPTGMKPIVMGSDDAAEGNLTYVTHNNLLEGKPKLIFGEPLIVQDSMVGLLERYVSPEEGRINFTFYISFDAIPFRQLGGYENPGFPYSSIPIVAKKIRYLDENFILGIHSLSHIYAYNMGVDAFVQDVKAAWELLDEYAGGEAQTLRTLAFPFGINPLTPELKAAISALSLNGRSLAGAFNFNNKFTTSPGRLEEPFSVNRINIDNKNWDTTMKSLTALDAVVARREFIWETTTKRLPQGRKVFKAKDEDGIWVLIRKPE